MTDMPPGPAPGYTPRPDRSGSANPAGAAALRGLRVLFYNWADAFDGQGLGGGIAAYQRNLAPLLAGAGVRAGYLSSGLVQDLRPRRAPRWEKIRPAVPPPRPVPSAQRGVNPEAAGAQGPEQLGPEQLGTTGKGAAEPGAEARATERQGAARQIRAGQAAAWQTSTGQTATGQTATWQDSPAQHAPQRYRLVNARPFAPGHAAFGMAEQIRHPPTEAAFADFLRATGPWDVVQFDSLEGLPLACLQLARDSGARVVVMLHNYYPFCPQVNLWQRETRNCGDFLNGAACLTCLPHPPPDPAKTRLRLALRHRGAALLPLIRRLRAKRSPTGPDAMAEAMAPHMPAAVAAPVAPDMARDMHADMARTMPPPPDSAAPAPDSAAQRHAGAAGFAQRRTAMLAGLNAHADQVLCVSERVRVLAAGFGISPDRLACCRIGTPQGGQAAAAPRPLLDDQGCLTLAYPGYVRRDKGFWFLLAALESLPADLAPRLRVILAARGLDAGLQAQIRPRLQHLAGLSMYDGYGPNDLDRILAGAGLGVVPVLWEDNLPQVAMEMAARGMTLLTSDLGGAHELQNRPDLTFAAGDQAGFHARLRAICEGRIAPGAAPLGAAIQPGLSEHMAELSRHWKVAPE